MSLDRSVLDAHVHVWTDDVVAYPFGPHDDVARPSDAFPGERLTAAMDAAGVGQALAIQPRVYGYDHAYLLAAASQLGNRLRVMPLINVARSTAVDEADMLIDRRAVAGLRVIAFGDGRAAALVQAPATRVWNRLTDLGFPIGLFLEPHRLPIVETLAQRHPGLSIVLDHLAGVGAEAWPLWGPVLLRMSRLPNVHVKVSALGHLSRLPFPHDDMRRGCEQLLDSYGAGRLLWGSDWPHVYRDGTYEHSHRAIQKALSAAGDDELELVLNGTARSLFRFPACVGDSLPAAGR